MERHIDLKEVSDGRLYGLEDMVRADCAGCAGCSACCQGMGSSVVLDPLDVHRLTLACKVGAEELLSKDLELNVVDGIILPNLKMTGVGERCTFLDANGRCRVHAFRPGICRIFPLGRLYEDGGFRYFLQIHECKKESRAKVKVKKWIDTPGAVRYDSYVADWHYFLKELQRLAGEDEAGQTAKNISLLVLKTFYLTPYDSDGDFYGQLYARLDRICGLLGIGGRRTGVSNSPTGCS